LARTGRARASGRRFKAASEACWKGCEYARQLRTEDALNACYTGRDRNFATATALTLFVNPLAGALASGASLAILNHCVDQALLQQKAGHWDCQQPGCPGFDVHDKQYGPCASCERVKGMCCPSQTVMAGYTCCICCDAKGNGCKAPPC